MKEAAEERRQLLVRAQRQHMRDLLVGSHHHQCALRTEDRFFLRDFSVFREDAQCTTLA
jgi:hypothetical protein